MAHKNFFNKNGKDSNLKNQVQKDNPMEIHNLNYEEHEQLFGEIAKKWAETVKEEANTTTNKINQIRTFYDNVLELYNKSETLNDDNVTYKKTVYPFVIMLTSKVTYASERKLVSKTFVDMIIKCVKAADSIEKLRNFKLFFEAFIGFYPRKNK